jgi:hypothetical protein
MVPLAHSHVRASCANGIPGLWYHISRLLAFLTAAERTSHFGSGLDRRMHCTLPGSHHVGNEIVEETPQGYVGYFLAPWSRKQLRACTMVRMSWEVT